MGEPENRQVCLEAGLKDEKFVAALLEMISGERFSYEQRLHTEKKSGLEEHITSLVFANGACVGIDRIGGAIVEIHDRVKEKEL